MTAGVGQPANDVPCVACGSAEQDVICEVEAQHEYLRRFHRRRLRPTGTDMDAALADRADFTQDYAARIVACRNCGLVFRSPRPSDDAVARMYAGDTYGENRLYSLFTAQRNLYREKARDLRRFLGDSDETPRIVEVGSFVGGFLAAAQERGWDAHGVDPGAEVGAFCRRNGYHVHAGTLEDAPLAPASVDCIAIWNTFDQLPDPQPTLHAARRLLRPGGVLAARVPNGACFRRCAAWNRRLPRPLDGWLRDAMAWNNVLTFPYLHGYSVSTLDRLLAPHGFRRIAFFPDTLPRLSDEQTRRWAALEEAVLKFIVCRAADIEMLFAEDNLALAPWLDVYYRLPRRVA